ncbi:MAG: hypothetical protein ACJ762_15790 [Solirubrobacteraceae bacterium]
MLPLAGCATTQDRNARARLDATRLLSARKPTTVTAPNPDVRVGKVALLHHDGDLAMVVELHNGTDNPLTDLPIAVGLQRGGKRVQLNGGGSRNYFQSHVAALPAGGDARWVFTASGVKDLGGTPYAAVGRPAQPPISAASALPSLAVSTLSKPGPELELRVRNGTDVPQYTLPVYAFAQRGTRYTAAGRATLHHLGTGQEKRLKLSLVGSTAGARLSLQALPSMFE